MLTTAVAVGAALVGTAFALSTYERWLHRHRRHELAWTAAMAMFALAAFAMAAGAALGWSPVTFRLFYLFGAIADVPFLALGTVYLLAGPRTGDRWAAVVTAVVVFAAGVLTVAPVRHHIDPAVLPTGHDVFGPLPQVFAGVCSGAGALVVFGGSAWSAWRFRRGRMLWANVVIAIGTATLSASGLLNSVLGAMRAFAVTLTVGISILFAGFLLASAGPRPPLPAELPTPSAAGAEAASQPRRPGAPRRS
jgi:hypothetical protein